VESVQSYLGFLEFCENRLGQVKEEILNNFLTEEKVQQQAGHYQTLNNQSEEGINALTVGKLHVELTLS